MDLFFKMIMEPRADWNAMGPRLPAWFRRRLTRLDPKLVLQFIPARSERHPDGIHPSHYPHGVWIICRKVPGRTGWLFKRWIWNLADSWGRYSEPGMDTINMLRIANQMWRANNCEALETEFGATIDAIKAQQARDSQAAFVVNLERLCRKYDVTMGHNHVFMRGSSISAA